MYRRFYLVDDVEAILMFYLTSFTLFLLFSCLIRAALMSVASFVQLSFYLVSSFC